MVKAYLNIKESVPQITRLIRKALIEEINKKFTESTVIELVNAIRDDIKLALLAAPEAQSLLNGELRGQFGFYDGTEDRIVKAIINTIANNIEFKFNKMSDNGNKVNGGFEFYVAKSNFSDILSLDESIIKTEKGQSLYWLEWLLVKGDRIIIDEHTLLFKRSASRSHSYIMIKTGGFWKVPSEFSGTIKNNWITRALDEKTNKISEIIAARLEKVF